MSRGAVNGLHAQPKVEFASIPTAENDEKFDEVLMTSEHGTVETVTPHPDESAMAKIGGVASDLQQKYLQSILGVGHNKGGRAIISPGTAGAVSQ